MTKPALQGRQQLELENSMPRLNAPYDTAELELVKRNLSGILSLKPELITSIVRSHPDEIRPVANLLQRFSAQMKGYKWKEAVLAQVPCSAWEIGPFDTPRINPKTSASMRYLSQDEPSEEALHLMGARRALLDGLLAEMKPTVRAVYRPMLTWIDAKEFRAMDLSKYPLSSDTEFGYNLLILEQILSDRIYLHDQEWRKNKKLSPSTATPTAVTRASAICASEELASTIKGWLDDDRQVSDKVPESLLTRVSANLSVNRVLLEYVAMDARGAEAANMCVRFLTELNRQRITAVPDSMINCRLPNAKAHLQELLTGWFAYGGSLVQSGGFFKRPMTNSDIDIVLDWSQQLQGKYIEGRGQNYSKVEGESEAKMAEFHEEDESNAKAKESHGNPGNLFIFAMAMIGAFYGNSFTKRELTGHSSSTYAVFPDRGEVAKGNRITPPTHAAQFLQQAYGQIFFANMGWELKADRVRNHSETTSIKRAYFQLTLNFAVKNRSSRQLLALNQNLLKLRVPHDTTNGGTRTST